MNDKKKPVCDWCMGKKKYDYGGKRGVETCGRCHGTGVDPAPPADVPHKTVQEIMQDRIKDRRMLLGLIWRPMFMLTW